MYKVSLVLEQLVDTFDDVSLSKHDSVIHRHKFVLHVRFQTMYEMYALVEQCFKEFLFDISSVNEHFSIQDFCKNAPHPFISVINICPCKTEGYNLARVIAEQVQFEAVAPTHSTFSVLRETGKYLVKITPYIMTYRYHGTVDKCYPCTFTKGIKLHKHHHLEENTWH